MSKANMKLIITFDTTMDSIAFEKACKPYDLGRLIPTPQIISAGCGFSWCMNEEDKEKIAKYREYVYDVKSIERNKWLCFLIPLFFWIVLIVLLGIGLSFLVSYASKLGY